MKLNKRIIPLTNKQIRQRATILVSLLVICLVSLAIGIFQAANPDILVPMIILCFATGLIGLLMAFGLFVQQAPKSRAFQKSSKVTQAIVLRSVTEECKRHSGGSAGAADGGFGCLGIILEIFLFAASSPTYEYYLDVQFRVEEIKRTQNLRVKVDNDLYSRVKQGSEIEVQYATDNPHVLLIGPEILNKSAPGTP